MHAHGRYVRAGTAGCIYCKYITCRQVMRGTRAVGILRRGRHDTHVGEGKQLEEFGAFLLCASAVNRCFLPPDKPEGFTQTRRERRRTVGRHESQMTSHAVLATRHCPYSSPPEFQASGAASSNRVLRERKTKFSVPVGPLRCFAMISSALARSSSGRSVL